MTIYPVSVLYDTNIGIACLNNGAQFNKCGLHGCCCYLILKWIILQLFDSCIFSCCFRFMPSLKYIVQNANDPELRLLSGKTIECISLIGLAVGRDKVSTAPYFICQF